jgi:hypothetical protein
MKRVICLFVLAFLFSRISFSQTYPILVTATVLSPLNVTSSNLVFGDVLRGVNKIIIPGDAASGKWVISGVASKQVQFSIATPPDLETASSNYLVYSYSGTDCKWSTDPSGTPGTTFAPSSTITASLSSSGNLYIFVGGTLKPTSNQAAGSYTGDANLTLQYTGN